MQEINSKQAKIIAFAGSKIDTLTNYREKINAIKVFTKIAEKYDLNSIEHESLMRALHNFVAVFGDELNVDTIGEYDLGGVFSLIGILKDKNEEPESYRVFEKLLHAVETSYDDLYNPILKSAINNFGRLPKTARDDLANLLSGNGKPTGKFGFQVKHSDITIILSEIEVAKDALDYLFIPFGKESGRLLIEKEKASATVLKRQSELAEGDEAERQKAELEASEAQQALDTEKTRYFQFLEGNVIPNGIDNTYIEIIRVPFLETSSVVDKFILIHGQLSASEKAKLVPLYLQREVTFSKSELTSHYLDVFNSIINKSDIRQNISAEKLSNILDYLCTGIEDAHDDFFQDEELIDTLLQISSTLLEEKRLESRSQLIESILSGVDFNVETLPYMRKIINLYPQYSELVSQKVIKSELEYAINIFLESDESNQDFSQEQKEPTITYIKQMCELAQPDMFGAEEFELNNPTKEKSYFLDNLIQKPEPFVDALNEFITLVETIFCNNRPTLNKEYYESLIERKEKHILRLGIKHLLEMSNSLREDELDPYAERLVEIFWDVDKQYDLQIIANAYEVLINHCPSMEIERYTKSNEYDNSRGLIEKFVYKKSIKNLIDKAIISLKKFPEPKVFKDMLYLLDDIIISSSQNGKIADATARINGSLQDILQSCYNSKKPHEIGYILDFMYLNLHDTSDIVKSRFEKLLKDIARRYRGGNNRRVKNLNMNIKLLTANKYKAMKEKKFDFLKSLEWRRQ